jgi:putative RNA 2'-phosphotransferase
MHPTLFDTARSADFAFLVLSGHISAAGLDIDAEGWAEVPYILRALKAEGHILSRFEFERLVASDPEGRLVMSADRRRIRAVLPKATEAIMSAAMAAAE